MRKRIIFLFLAVLLAVNSFCILPTQAVNTSNSLQDGELSPSTARAVTNTTTPQERITPPRIWLPIKKIYKNDTKNICNALVFNLNIEYNSSVS